MKLHNHTGTDPEINQGGWLAIAYKIVVYTAI